MQHSRRECLVIAGISDETEVDRFKRKLMLIFAKVDCGIPPKRRKPRISKKNFKTNAKFLQRKEMDDIKLK